MCDFKEIFLAGCMVVERECSYTERMPEKYWKNCCCLNCPQCCPYVSARYGWKYSEKKTLAVEWILMLIQKQRAVISAGIRTGAGVAPRCNLFKPLSLTNLKVGFKRQEYERVGGVKEEAWTGAPQHQRLLTIHRNMDDSQYSGLNFGCACRFYYSQPTECPCEEKALFWIRLLASVALASCGF